MVFRISNKDEKDAKQRLMQKKGIKEDHDGITTMTITMTKGGLQTKSKPAKVSDASKMFEIEHIIVPQLRKAITKLVRKFSSKMEDA